MNYLLYGRAKYGRSIAFSSDQLLGLIHSIRVLPGLQGEKTTRYRDFIERLSMESIVTKLAKILAFQVYKVLK